MGIHGSATCVMTFDDATGWLVGEREKGLRAMFTMMNEARLGVGMQGLALSEVATQNAAAYARERRQGRALTGAADPHASADPIVVHPDVRRMLAAMRGFNIANAGCKRNVKLLQGKIDQASAELKKIPNKVPLKIIDGQPVRLEKEGQVQKLL